eukprot:scaffold426_cov219-Amphora_coffeaeformis.AAC.60
MGLHAFGLARTCALDLLKIFDPLAVSWPSFVVPLSLFWHCLWMMMLMIPVDVVVQDDDEPRLAPILSLYPTVHVLLATRQIHGPFHDFPYDGRMQGLQPQQGFVRDVTHGIGRMCSLYRLDPFCDIG